MPLRVGETFAGYRILRLLGSGGMGEVYLAQHPRLPRQDALKVLRLDVSSDSSFRERFIREADLAAGLRHPHVVAIHDRGQYERQLWIAMDYIDGTDAAQLIAQRYPAGMPADIVIPIITAVASALDYAHRKGFLHRDVKPANIIVGDDLSVFLADFGIAKSLADVSGITTTNMTVGTVAYAAPEQLMGEETDGRADQYALAATAYNLLTGQQLFPQSNAAVVISRHLTAVPPMVGNLRPDCACFDEVLQIALAKEPSDRFPSCSAFAQALTDEAPQSGAASAKAPTQRAPRSPRPTPAQVAAQPTGAPPTGVRHRWAVGSSLAVMILLVGLIALAWQPWDDVGSGTPTVPSTDQSLTPDQSPSPSAPTSVRPPPPTLFPASKIDQVLLTDDQLTRIVGTSVTDDPAGGAGGGLVLQSSAYGTGDHSGQVTPPSCVGVVFTGEHAVYGASKMEQIKTQIFGTLYHGPEGEPHLLQQTVAVFPSSELARSFFEATETRWASCASGEVNASLGYENAAGYKLGDVQHNGDVIAVAMATNSGLNGPDACQQALGVRENVIVEARSCAVPDIVTNYDPSVGWPRDPNWAPPFAERVVEAMLGNVNL